MKGKACKECIKIVLPQRQFCGLATTRRTEWNSGKGYTRGGLNNVWTIEKR